MVKLGDVVSFIGGSQPPKSTFKYELEDGYVRLLQIRDYKSDKNLTYIKANSTKKFCDKHDIMIGRYGPPVFQILKGLEGAYNVALMKAKPSDKVDSNYLYYFLKQETLFRLIDGLSQRTAGQSGVDMDALKAYPMILPPLAEQKRIAAILDKADTIRRKRQQAINLADDFLRSVFLDMFGDPMFSERYKRLAFKEFVTLQQGLQIPISKRKATAGEDRYKYLTVKYLNGKGEDEYIQSPRQSVVVKREQILMTRTGNTGQVISGVEGVFHNNFIRLASTTTIPDLNHSDFLDVTIAIPPKSKQEEFIKFEKVILAMKEKYVDSFTESQNMFNSLSQKAFAGEL